MLGTLLQGADSDWNAPTDQRSVSYANLSPRRYTFLVRTVNSEGTASDKQASVAFEVIPPVWGRWWAQLLAAAFVCTILYALHRYRTARLLAIERLRTRIAADLHDDIGSGLSQVAILAEVARNQIRAGAGAQTAGEIADTARGLLDALSDVVWSINPRRDDLSSLTQRINKFASALLEQRGVAWKFEPAPNLDGISLRPELRRDVYLILKEAVHNASRHSGAAQVSMRISVSHHDLVAEVLDNGSGFDVDAA